MRAAERVSQLGRDPDFTSATLTECSHTEYVTVDDADLTRMVKENLVAERIAITTYEIGQWIRGHLGYLTGCPGPGTFAASSAMRRSCCAASVHSPFGLAGRIGRRQLLLPVRFPEGRPNLALRAGTAPYVVHDSGAHHGRHDCVGYAARG